MLSLHKSSTIFLFLSILIIIPVSIFANGSGENNIDLEGREIIPQEVTAMGEIATIGGGCFWCVEAVYEKIEGINSVISGYSGGTVANPRYEEVTSGRTGHAEVVQIDFDPEVISYREIIDLFWQAHDPTTLNRQGYDVGTQYRSIILTHSPEQEAEAKASLTAAQEYFTSPIVTEIKTFEAFYEAEDYHQDFFANNPNYGYCQAVIAPKLRKLGIDQVPVIDVTDILNSSNN
jgi:peptide-methionine (S)-S-oxide reductase